MPETEHWDLIIRPKAGWLELHLRDLWQYRDLVAMFVRRDFVSLYKQTILGPLWFFIQPLLTTITYTVVFSGIAKLPTAGLPPLLFYLAGQTPWNYFATCVLKTSATFTDNAGLFGKVYFPRLVTPLAIVISTLIQFGIQFGLLLIALVWYLFTATVHPNWAGIVFLTPLLIVLMAGQGLGFGIIVSSLTTRYRDLSLLVTFGIQLAMYTTPVVIPLSAVGHNPYQTLIEANPMTAIIESFRAIYLGSDSGPGSIPWSGLGYSSLATVITLVLGILIFNKVEKTFMDTV